MRISVFGLGYVGTVTCACLAKLGHHVIGVDVKSEIVALLGEGRSSVIEPDLDGLLADALSSKRLTTTLDAAQAVEQSDFSFVAVDTPADQDGGISLAAMNAVLAQIGQALSHTDKPHTVVMRSTVPTGTAEKNAIPLLEKSSGRKLGSGLAYYSNPEFLREGSAVRDFFEPAMSLVGAASGDPATSLCKIYADLKPAPRVVSFSAAESVKVASNVFHAVKMTFANEAGAILASQGLDSREIFKLLCEDRVLNVSPAYLRPGFAFGGHCLPKDIQGFLHLAGGTGIKAPFLSQLLPGNAAVLQRAVDLIDPRPGQHVLLLGLAFKPGTNDLRNSSFVALAENLLAKGVELQVLDRLVDADRAPPLLQQRLTGDLVDATRSASVVVVGHLADSDRSTLASILKSQTVVDLLGLRELAQLSGITYRGLCW